MHIKVDLSNKIEIFVPIKFVAAADIVSDRNHWCQSLEERLAFSTAIPSLIANTNVRVLYWFPFRCMLSFFLIFVPFVAFLETNIPVSLSSEH